MQRNFVGAGIAAILILAPGAAWAAHGKPGLWTVTSTMHMDQALPMSPGMTAMMQKKGMKMPMAGEPIITQMCMTQAEVDADKPPRITTRQIDCDTKVLSQSASSMKSETICHGVMEGSGHSEISWRGAEHYTGSYSFKGTMHGKPNSVSNSFKGDWVKADCGSVKPATAH